MACADKVALVTGASRGIGTGIALGLAKAGATVIITGRRKNSTRVNDYLTNELNEVAAAINDSAVAGGSCRAVFCDHSSDAESEELFEEIFAKEGRIDILVNNAFSGLDANNGRLPGAFWEKSLSTWDAFNNVGLRSHYICSVLAARRWIKQGTKGTIIVNVSSLAGFEHAWDVCYGVGKAAVDRLTADTAKELKPHGVTVVSLWPGAVRTEVVERNLKDVPTLNKQKMQKMDNDKFAQNNLESCELSGRCVVALASDPNVERFTGTVLLNPEICEEYGFTDIDGMVKWGERDFLKAVRKGMRFPPRQWQSKFTSKTKPPEAKL